SPLPRPPPPRPRPWRGRSAAVRLMPAAAGSPSNPISIDPAPFHDQVRRPPNVRADRPFESGQKRAYNRGVNPPVRSEPLTPLRIHADRAARQLQIEWPDNHATTYDF